MTVNGPIALTSEPEKYSQLIPESSDDADTRPAGLSNTWPRPGAWGTRRLVTDPRNGMQRTDVNG